MESSGTAASATTPARTNARGLAGWLKFFGIITIIAGALNALSLVGILWAWLPIWLGVLLVQAGSRAGKYAGTGSEVTLEALLGKLKSYYLITGIVTIVWVGIVLLGGIVLAVLTIAGLVSLPELMESIRSGGFGS
jgi:hypothetical protein